MNHLLEIHPGNQPPNHDNMVAVVAKSIDGQLFKAQDRRHGKRSWMYWKNVVMWQELSGVVK